MVDYLVKKGVAPERLQAIGHGQDNPIGDNKTAKGRGANRRVEFNIVSDDSSAAAPAPASAPAPAPAGPVTTPKK